MSIFACRTRRLRIATAHRALTEAQEVWGAALHRHAGRAVRSHLTLDELQALGLWVRGRRRTARASS